MAQQNNYWIKRERDNITREQMKDEQVVNELRRIINVALKSVEEDINTFYKNYAKNNKISKAEAKKRVSKFDVRAFEKFAREYVKDKDFSEKANKELYTYNTKMRVSRQELLMMYLNAHLVAMANEQVKTFQEYLEQVGIVEVARQAGILGVKMTMSTTTLKALVGASFYGATWSERIWDDMHKLRNELEPIINSAIIRGVNPVRFVPKIRERFDVTKFEARRLLITEASRVQIESQRLSYLELTNNDPNAEYEFVAKIDNLTSKVCEGLDGKRFKVKNMTPGINAPSMHPFCRSSTALLAGNWREKFFADKKYIL